MAKNPQTVTIYGRLSFPTWTYKEALARNAKSDFPQPDENVTPDFNLLVEQPQLDKFLAHIKGEFFPFLAARHAAGEKRNSLEPKHITKLEKLIAEGLKDGGWNDMQPPYIPIKDVHDKTAALVPEAVASIKVKGNRGVDVELKAIVENEDELAVPDPDILKYPIIRPIGQTVHQMYPGAYVAATLNLYSFVSGVQPGFSASAGVAVFKADGDRLGGGVEVDEDEMFLD